MEVLKDRYLNIILVYGHVLVLVIQNFDTKMVINANESPFYNISYWSPRIKKIRKMTIG